MVQSGSRTKTAGAVALVLAAVLACVVLLACGCQPDESSLAARYDGGVVTEEEVNAYTAQFRQDHRYENDDTWAQYLLEENLTASTWRQRAVGTIVEKRLVKDEAAKAGIKPDEARVEAQMAQDRQAAGVAANDDQAWSSYLKSLGKTEQQYREDLEFASIESQLLMKNIALDPARDEELLTNYMTDRNNMLLSRIARRYSVLIYNTAQAAQTALDSMAGLSGDELAARFAALADQDDSNETTSQNKGDVGWDIAADLGDLQADLANEQLGAGELSAAVHEIDGTYYVAMCTDRYVFSSASTYGSLPDDLLKSYIVQAATYSLWTQRTQDYLADLLASAHVKYREPSKRLPYDVDDKIAALKAKAQS